MSRTIASFTKDPSAVLDYSISWASWLTSGDAVSTATWTVTGADSVLEVAGSPAPSVSSGVATAWLTGGTAGARYVVTCRVTTTGGRTDDRSITIAVADR